MRANMLWVAAAFAAAAVTSCAAQQRVLIRHHHQRVVAAAPAVDPEVVTLEHALGNRFVAASASTQLIARLRVAARAPENAARPPVNLALVVDTSGSMEGDAIANARAASLALLDALTPSDRLAVVVFHSRTEVLVPSTPLASADRAQLRARIAAMHAHGTTDMAGGLRAGLEQLAAGAMPDGVNRVVLLSDGVPNDPAPIAALARSAGERGASITALGLGLDYDPALLGAVAQHSGGRFHYIADSERVAEVFRDEVLRIRRVVARNAVALLSPGPGVRIDAVVGQQSTRAGEVTQVQLGDLAADEPRDLIVRMTVQARRDGATVELLDAALSFDDAVVQAGRLERRAFLSARATSDAATLSSGRDVEVERAAQQAQAAAAQVEAVALARAADLARARAALDHAEADARAWTRAHPADRSLDSPLAAIASLREVLPTMAPRPAEASAQAPVTPSPPHADRRPDLPRPAVPPEHLVRQLHHNAMQTLTGN